MTYMGYFFTGITYGAAAGLLAWFAGWALSKVFKLFQYVAR